MKDRLIFDYMPLRARILEKFGTQEKFARALKISTSALNNKLNGRSEFDQKEILESLKLLEIDQASLKRYFFTPKS